MSDKFKVANLGKGQRTIRYWGAVWNIAVAIVIGAVLVMLGWSQWWRLLVFVPLGLGILSYLEAREKTCVWLANRGECSLDEGIKLGKVMRGDKLEDASLADQLKAKGRSITVRGYGIAVIITAIFVLLPI
jgi:hypothetical protein